MHVTLATKCRSGIARGQSTARKLLTLPLPIDAVEDLPYNTGVDCHVDGKQASALVHCRRCEVEKGEGGRLGIGSHYALQDTHCWLHVPTCILCHHEHLHMQRIVSFAPLVECCLRAETQAIMRPDTRAYCLAGVSHQMLADCGISKWQITELRST